MQKINNELHLNQNWIWRGASQNCIYNISVITTLIKKKLEMHWHKKGTSEPAVTTTFTAVDISETTFSVIYMKDGSDANQNINRVYLNMHVYMLLKRHFIFTHYI
jgi:high-affinity Fe2+/Pb2+ permease